MNFLATNRNYRRFQAFQAALSQAAQAAELPSPNGLFFLSREGLQGAQVVLDGQRYTNFSSYDYLGLSQHPAVADAVVQCLGRQGLGAGASRIVAGQAVEHEALDQALAKLLDCPAAMSFSAGFLAMASTVGFLAGRRDLVLHDAYMHRSSIEGIQTSGAAAVAFRHNDVAHLRQLLASTPCEGTRFVLVEGIYSMDGDVCPLDEVVALKKDHAFELIVDEAHSLGVLGRTGRGIAEHFGLPREVATLWMGTLSKSLGACGGYAAGDAALIEYLRHRCPGFVYSAGMPPPVAAGAHAAVQLLMAQPSRVAALQALSKQALRVAQDAGLNTGHAQGTPILPIILGTDEAAFFAACALFKAGVYVHPLGWPAAPKGAARLRFFLTAGHTAPDITRALTRLAQVAEVGR